MFAFSFFFVIFAPKSNFFQGSRIRSIHYMLLDVSANDEGYSAVGKTVWEAAHIRAVTLSFCAN